MAFLDREIAGRSAIRPQTICNQPDQERNRISSKIFASASAQAVSEQVGCHRW
jgi:hypothetical protein